MKKERQNLYFIVINKTGGMQFFTQLKEVYREDQEKMTSNQALSAASVFYAIDHLTQTIMPKEVTKIESERDPDFERDNAIDMLITDQYLVSCLLTLTGLRFIIIQSNTPQRQQTQYAELQRKHEESMSRMRQLYRLYTDYFSKDPFQQDDQPLGEKKKSLI